METCSKAIDKFDGAHNLRALQRIRGEHEKTASELREDIFGMGGTPESDPGHWGDVANGVQAATNLFGENSAAASLIQGEKHGIRQYEDAIKNGDTMPDCREKMLGIWMPRLRLHIEKLKRMP